MQIKPNDKASPVSKVEQDQRVEVSKIKPIGTNQVPDSFEKGSSSPSSNESKGSGSAEPEKKAGQITGGILIKQMTAARLGKSGIKSAGSRQLEEIGGRQDLSPGDQDVADTIKPKVKKEIPKDNVGTPGLTTSGGPRIPESAFTGNAKSNREQNSQEMQNFLANHGFDMGSGNVNASNSTGSGITDPSQSGGAPRGNADDLNNAIGGGPPGPGNPMDSVNEKVAGMNYAKNMNSLENIATEMQNDASGAQGDANIGYGKDMIAEEKYGYAQNAYETEQGAETAYKYLSGLMQNNEYADQMDKEAAKVQARSDAIREIIKNGGPLLAEHTNPPGKIKINLSPSGQPASIPPSLFLKIGQSRGGTASGSAGSSGSSGSAGSSGSSGSSGSAGSSGSSGTSGTSGSGAAAGGGKGDTTQENYHDPKIQKMKQGINSTLKNLGLGELVDLPKAPHGQGDGPDPSPEATPVSKDEPNIYSQLGEYGMVGQPTQQNEGGGGPSMNGVGDRPGGGGAIDNEDGSGWHGVTRTEEASDVIEPDPKPKQTTEDDEQKNQTTTAQDVTKKKSKLNANMTPKF